MAVANSHKVIDTAAGLESWLSCGHNKIAKEWMDTLHSFILMNVEFVAPHFYCSRYMVKAVRSS